MRTKFYLDGKKITKKALQERIGEERLKRLVQEAKETFLYSGSVVKTKI